MALSPTRKAWLQIHFCVVLWGFTAILGKLIHLRALPLVFWRMTIVTLVLALVPAVWRGITRMSWRTRAAFAGVGVVVGLHWFFFYLAIKLSNASIGATCMALGPVFLAGVEPWIAKRPFNVREILLGVAVVPGVVLVVGGVSVGMRVGIAVGVLSTFLCAIFSAFNKRLIGEGDALAVTALEIGSGAVMLAALAQVVPHVGPALPFPDGHDLALLGALSVLCTVVPFSLALVALRRLSAFTTQLAVNLEPVYAVLLGALWLRESQQLRPSFYAGVIIILAGVLGHAYLEGRRGRRLEVAELGLAESKGMAE